ncbi:MAG: hypothetical protein KGL39_26845 [Patescibacteria group bacterium]|nr:hypothetical protein [Patescibacteria group bacterium]
MMLDRCLTCRKPSHMLWWPDVCFACLQRLERDGIDWRKAEDHQGIYAEDNEMEDRQEIQEEKTSLPPLPPVQKGKALCRQCGRIVAARMLGGFWVCIEHIRPGIKDCCPGSNRVGVEQKGIQALSSSQEG